ncbi:zinc finger and SCAN domain-containing protein 1-like [Papio anubis]|uniref:zinc finger and SCAN domain-containing protein 1 n=1 Tax=Papio anubis TaxID=9555 RepID=UPI0012ADC5C2|nr:zinc finger and SCAN domain-containing protein 1 [Papio anubis]XP_031517156.1 zinc finger and SCAN domain-containing protein 1 [Papio anubis]XP_031517157.1 zinc finger and SCAN domain-containing protein 1 [Papio anubis]XP_031517158.1 zinc finger and SCAN domain-containing protein 1 [Papio anubis]XP_031517159.1 zinc finger and SCAN domain-containing protein 1 [Papio anubis]XP_031517160.1 zinc finger and SCAN domain-containing protein 1 [Papio anubis]XP_031517161.1 zinc finger and SCAN domai
MLPRPKAPASPRRPQTPTLSEQDADPGPASPRDTEAQRLRFRQFQYHVAGGPHLALGQLWTLCRQWLRPEARSKEQMLELLVLEQFLGALPSKMRTWVQSQGPRSCREAASLVEDLTQMCQQEVLVSLDSVEHQDWSFGEEEDGKSPRSQREPSQVSPGPPCSVLLHPRVCVPLLGRTQGNPIQGLCEVVPNAPKKPNLQTPHLPHRFPRLPGAQCWARAVSAGVCMPCASGPHPSPSRPFQAAQLGPILLCHQHQMLGVEKVLLPLITSSQ